MKPSSTDKIYPVNGIATLIQALEAEGVPNFDALDKLELSPEQLLCPNTRVSLNQIIQCYCNAMRLSADPYFAFHAGLRFHVSTYRMYGFGLLSGTDFRQTARFAEQYHKLAVADAVIGFEDKGACAKWTIAPATLPSIDSNLYRFIVELYFGVVISLSRDVMGPTFMPRELCVTYGSDSGIESGAKVFECRVLFGQNENALALDKEWLDGPTQVGNKVSFQEAIELCDQLIEEMHFKIGIAGSVRDALLANLAQPIGFEALARRLRISERTLKRKLRLEGTSYRKIVDDLRTQVAIKYLRDTELAIIDVASHLGFSDPGNFRDAFRRWTMETPSEFRHRIKNGLSPA